MNTPNNKMQAEALKSSREILDEEIREAEMELERPAVCLFAAGLMGGLGIGVSLLLMGVVLTLVDGPLQDPLTAFLVANAHTVGFIIVVMGRADLFTEYTTLAVLPILKGRASVAKLARFWGWIYLANLLGVALFALVTLGLGPSLDVVEPGRLVEFAHELLGHAWWATLLSAVVAGWLMGLVAWMVTSGRETISQVFFVWLVTLVIALAHLHHSISGFALVFFAWLEGAVAGATLGHFVLWVTAGNAIGGVVFALLTYFRTTMRSR
ncbi:MAG: formate/nitrite transporter family protein [Proteobacteria bacterium]|nr:formate/nitrite transporter family protein [Pseudomonadota bacterium]